MTSDIEALASELEARYRQELVGRFPYQDCYKIQELRPSESKGFIPDLDMYSSYIAGFSSSATSLAERPIVQLQNALPQLKKSFWEAHPQYKSLADLVTPAETPVLFKRLQVADGLRLGLVKIIEHLMA